jgi:uncharacterized SAM-binding protein YcdF (DUF218 family)
MTFIPALSSAGALLWILFCWSGVAAAAFITWNLGSSFERRAARLGARYSTIAFIVTGSGAVTCLLCAEFYDLLHFFAERSGQ